MVVMFGEDLFKSIYFFEYDVKSILEIYAYFWHGIHLAK